MRAHQIMTPQVITVAAETTIIEAIHLMLQHHIGGLPVLDKAGSLIGIVSEGDFIRRAELGTQHKRAGGCRSWQARTGWQPTSPASTAARSPIS